MSAKISSHRPDGSPGDYKNFFERYPHFLDEFSVKEGWRIVREVTSVDAKLPVLGKALRERVLGTDPRFVAFVLTKAKLLNPNGEEVTSGMSMKPIEYHETPVFGNWTGVCAPMIRGASTAATQRMIAAAGHRGDEAKQVDEYRNVDNRGVVRERWAIVRRWPHFLKAYPFKSGWRLILDCCDLDAVLPHEGATMVKRQRESTPDLIGYVMFKAMLINPKGFEAQSGTVLYPINSNSDFEVGETIATHALFSALNLPGDTQYQEDEEELKKLDDVTWVSPAVKTSATVTQLHPDKPKPPTASSTPEPAATVPAANVSLPAAALGQPGNSEDVVIKNPYTEPKLAKSFQHLSNQVLMMCKQRRLPVPSMSNIEEARAAYKALTKPKAKPAEDTEGKD